MGDGVNLDKIAEQELLNEAKRGAARASVYGALGWQKCPLKPTNKIFLQNILLSTISSTRRELDSDSHKIMKRKVEDLVASSSDSNKNVAVTDKKFKSKESEVIHSVHNGKKSEKRTMSRKLVRTDSERESCEDLRSISMGDFRQFRKQKHGHHKKEAVSSKLLGDDDSFAKK